MVELLKAIYRTPRGVIINAFVVQTSNGFKPVILSEGFLSSENEIIKVEQIAEVV